MWNKEEVLEPEEYVTRQISANLRKSAEGIPHKFPSPEHFMIREGKEDSLSFNREKYCSVDKSFILIGLRKGNDGNYINFENYVLYRYPISFLQSIPGFEKIIADPEHFGCPSPDGLPNNPSHSLLFCGEFKISTRSVLSLYCRNNSESKVTFKVKNVRQTINELRARQNDTEFHRNWEF